MPIRTATCHCSRVQYQALADPLDAKFCHCRTCQTLHGAPMQWAVIFRKSDIRFTRGRDLLHYYSSELDRHGHVLPCKVSCGHCRTPIADEGRNMWLAFPSLFGFDADSLPDAFRPTCHIFYGARILDVDDDLPKWSGHKDASDRL